LVELLSSSKFTAGTWEQFVCYLPNVTQDVIVGIKQNVEENEAGPFNCIDAVAQCCHSNPHLTWRNICIALLSSNEVTLARQIFEKHSKGPAREEALALAEDWQQEVFKSHHVSFTLLLCKKMKLSSATEIEFSSDHAISLQFQNLLKKFPGLVRDIRKFYASSKEYDVIDIARWIEESYEVTGLVHDGTTVDEIFNVLQPHYNFLCIDPLSDLMEEYPINDQNVLLKYCQYTECLESFTDSAKISEVMTSIEAALTEEDSKTDPKVVLKLSGKWTDRAIKNLQKLLEHFFPEEAKYLTIKKIRTGSIEIHFLAASYKVIRSLIPKAQDKV
uniref:Death domain-containing protein n=1 Tax=Amphimedon queenslandica TaxID=400682 RepID=A0A1X7V7U1_AMPQE